MAEEAEKKQQAEADARLKAEIAKRTAEVEARVWADKQRRMKEAEAERKRMAEEASRLLTESTPFPAKPDDKFAVFQMGPTFQSTYPDTKPSAKQQFKSPAGHIDVDSVEELGNLSDQADLLQAEIKKSSQSTEANVRAMTEETEGWKNVQKSLELEAPHKVKRGVAPRRQQKQQFEFKGFGAPPLRRDGKKNMSKKQVGQQATEVIDARDSFKAQEKKIRKEDSHGSKLSSVIDGSLYVVTPENIPELSRWKQNPADQSITGFVRNSSEFDNGTEITIETDRDGAKKGLVVTSLSGQQYKLN